MTAHITESVRRRFMNHDYKLTNQFVFDKDWESDYFGVTSSGYTYEVEVKVSLSDFKADFSKWKHDLFKRYNTGWYYRKRNWPMRVYDHKTKVWAEYNVLNMRKTSDILCPNRFYFACPDQLIPLESIPDYAGLIYVNEAGYCTIVKEAPFIHKNKQKIRRQDITGILLDKFYWRSVNLQNELKICKHQLEQERKRVEYEHR